MLTVHHLARSQSERVVWLCEELDLPYELVRYERDASGQAPAAFRALSDFQTAPVITEGGLTLGESGAIVEYILRRHAGGRLLFGPEHPDFAAFLFWFHFANGSFVPGLMLEHFAPEVAAAPGSRNARARAMIEARLAEAPYFAGESFTAADIMMDLPCFLARKDLTDSPNTAAYLARLLERPALRRALAKAEPDEQPRVV